MPVESDPNLADLHAEVQQFYARHMQLLDAGDAQAWARTFTADGSVALPALPEPVRGQAALAAGVRRSADALAEAGEVRRHCMLMIAVLPREDGSLFARSYTQIIATARNGQPRLHLMCVCEDVVVREEGDLKVRERRVTHDDRP